MPKLLTQGVSLEPKNGRQLIGIVAGFKSERWPVIDRNAGRLQLGIRTQSHPIRLCNPDQLRLIGCSLPCLYHIEGVPFGRKNRVPILWLLTSTACLT
jgi:hypothetical protein